MPLNDFSTVSFANENSEVGPYLGTSKLLKSAVLKDQIQDGEEKGKKRLKYNLAPGFAWIKN